MRTPLKALSASLTKGSEIKNQQQTREVHVEGSFSTFMPHCHDVEADQSSSVDCVIPLSKSDVSVTESEVISSSPALSCSMTENKKSHHENDGGGSTEKASFLMLAAQSCDNVDENLRASTSSFPSTLTLNKEKKRLPASSYYGSLSSNNSHARKPSAVASLVRSVGCEVLPSRRGECIILKLSGRNKFGTNPCFGDETQLNMAVRHGRRSSDDSDVLNEVSVDNENDSCRQLQKTTSKCLLLCPSDLCAIDPTSPAPATKHLSQPTTADVLFGTGSGTTVTLNRTPLTHHRVGTHVTTKKSFDDPFPTPSSVTLNKGGNKTGSFSGRFQTRSFSWEDDDDDDEDDEIIPWLPSNDDVATESYDSPNGSKLRLRRKCSINSTTTAATVDCLDSDSERIDFSPRSDRARHSHSALLDPFPRRHSIVSRRSSRSSSDQALSVYQTQRRRVSRAVRSTIQRTSNRLRHTSRNIRQSIKIKRRQTPKPKSSPWLIRADHPVKVAWDVFTVLLSFFSAYLTHTSIRERDYDKSGFFIRFCEIWFLVDILLNFITQHKTYRYDEQGHQSVTLDTPQHIWARYLTTWFFVDVISFLPWEKLWVKPVVEMQKRRNFWQKTGRRSRVVFKITRTLRGRHVKWFQTVSKQTKHIGYGGKQLLHLIIKYIPKYFIFCKNMKAILAVRFLRQVHWLRKILKNLWKINGDDAEGEEEGDEDSDDDDCGTSQEDEDDISTMDDDCLTRSRWSRQLSDQDDDLLSLASNDNFSFDSRLHKVQEVPVTPLKDRKFVHLRTSSSMEGRKSEKSVARRMFSFENDDPIGY